jgi:hypothetical protein
LWLRFSWFLWPARFRKEQQLRNGDQKIPEIDSLMRARVHQAGASHCGLLFMNCFEMHCIPPVPAGLYRREAEA